MLLERSNPAGGMGVCCEYCVVRWRFLRQSDHSSRAVLPNLCVCVCLWSWSLDSDEAWPTVGSSYHEKKCDCGIHMKHGTYIYQKAISGWNSIFMKFLRYVRHRVIKIKINSVPSFLSPSNCLTHVNVIVIQGVSKRALQLWKLIEIYTEDIHKVLNCQNVAKHTEFYLG